MPALTSVLASVSAPPPLPSLPAPTWVPARGLTPPRLPVPVGASASVPPRLPVLPLAPLQLVKALAMALAPVRPSPASQSIRADALALAPSPGRKRYPPRPAESSCATSRPADTAASLEPPHGHWSPA